MLPDPVVLDCIVESALQENGDALDPEQLERLGSSITLRGRKLIASHSRPLRSGKESLHEITSEQSLALSGH